FGRKPGYLLFVNYKRGPTLPKTELDSMSKRKLTTKFEEDPQKIDLPSSTLCFKVIFHVSI
ncbi:hypothetical protein ACIXQZ_11565, partial [Bacteroides fragilis]